MEIKTKTTFCILTLLILIRVCSPLIQDNISFILPLTYLFMIIVIILNAENLHQMNIDKYFYIIFIGGCIFLGWKYTNYFWGILLFLGLCLVYLEHQKTRFVFSSIKINIKSVLLFLSSFLLFIVLNQSTDLSLENILKSLEKASFYGVLFEEFLFRGIFWMYLRKNNVTEKKIIIVQTLFFWFAHYNLIGELSFVTSIPYISLILGLLVWQSKSLAMSFWAHFLYNFMIGITI